MIRCAACQSYLGAAPDFGILECPQKGGQQPTYHFVLGPLLDERFLAGPASLDRVLRRLEGWKKSHYKVVNCRACGVGIGKKIEEPWGGSYVALGKEKVTYGGAHVKERDKWQSQIHTEPFASYRRFNLHDFDVTAVARKAAAEQEEAERRRAAAEQEEAERQRAAAEKAAAEQAERDKLTNVQMILCGNGDSSAHLDPSELPFEYLAKCTKQWDPERKVGEGTFGDVFLALDTERELRFVVKKINVSSLSLVSDAPVELGRRMWSNEIVALTKFRSPLIVKLAGFTPPDAEKICLVYEYCAGGALDKVLTDAKKAAELTWKRRVRIALNVSKALNFLHRGGGGGEGARCFHRDVKAANVCLTETWSPKLIDCGLARFIPEGDARVAVTATGNSLPGTVGYMCPRYQSGAVKFSEKSEVFSLGVLLLEIVTGDVTLFGKRGNLYFHFCPPDSDDKVEELEDCFDERAQVDGEWPQAVKTELIALIKSCLKENPTKRIGLQAVLQQLRVLESAHCVESGSEKMIAELREERERHIAAAQIKDAAERAVIRTCSICFDDLPTSDGIACAGGHFCCSSCFDSHAKSKVEPESMRVFGSSGGIIGCPAYKCGAPPFTALEIARHVQAATFELISTARAKLVEQHINATLEKDFEKRLKQKEVEWQRLSENERRRRANRNHVVERILTLACPRCGQAFLDFTGCFALTCSRDNANFCAYCLADCGADAHGHVARCEHNSEPDKNVFASFEVFVAAQNNRRVRMLRVHLAKLSAEERKNLLEDCAMDFRDLGINPKTLL